MHFNILLGKGLHPAFRKLDDNLLVSVIGLNHARNLMIAHSRLQSHRPAGVFPFREAPGKGEGQGLRLRRNLGVPSGF